MITFTCTQKTHHHVYIHVSNVHEYAHTLTHTDPHKYTHTRTSATQCRAIFFTDVEYREHKKTCRLRMNSGSTDMSSDSVDIEELSNSDSNSDSSDTESDEEAPINQFCGSSGADKLSQLRKSVDPIHKSASANVIIPSMKHTPPRDRRSSESSTKPKGELATAMYSSPPKTRKSRLDSNKKASNVGSSSKALDLFGLATSDPDSGRPLYPGTGGYGLTYGDGVIMVYSDSDSDDSDYDDEGDVDISPSEMTRLLSLNDQDMYENEGSEEEGEEQGEEEEYGRRRMQGESWGNGVKTRHGEPSNKGTCTCTCMCTCISDVHM